MRPSRFFIILAVGLLLITCVIAVMRSEGGFAVQSLWALLGVVAFADLALSRTGRSVGAEAKFPDQIFVGTTGIADIKLTSTKGPLPTGLAMRFQVSPALQVGPFQWDNSAVDAVFDVPLTCNARGIFTFARLWLFWPSRFGLFDIISYKKFDHTIKGIPNIQPVLSGQITTIVQAALYGLKDTAFRGEGSEFHQLRDFTTGMDPRLIDWKRSARHGGLVARETHMEQNHQIIMCVDNGYLMREQIDGLPKIDRAINAALATTWAAGIGGDLVGFYSFDSRPRVYLPPAPGRAAFNRIRAEAAALAYSSVQSNHTLAFAHLNGLLNRRSLIIVFSDFVDSITAELMVENMAVLNRHHLLIFVALKDPALEAMISPVAPSLDDIARAVAAAQIQKERQIVLDRLRRLGVVCLDIAPDQLTPALVSAYLDIKARELI
ncbi:DUF58 domain-containing protein [Yoonia sp.]|uniref:DUF58 domain-containing protein n=1 Tax=Yoonia sp. TaxID=2212373 RepID=UPI0025D0C3AD|nr:DUF58 domain-containing protein [Yoonia sp.]